jgi:flagellar basal-body rod protein FlgB
LDIDNYLGVHARALQLESRRTELLAANLANADTPGYKARDIDFKEALATAGHLQVGTAPRLGLQHTNGQHLGPTGAARTSRTNAADEAIMKYRVPLAPALDGNTVDAQLEQAAFAENAVRYQATLTLLNMRLRGLMTAITGQ